MYENSITIIKNVILVLCYSFSICGTIFIVAQNLLAQTILVFEYLNWVGRNLDISKPVLSQNKGIPRICLEEYLSLCNLQFGAWILELKVPLLVLGIPAAS